MTQVLTYHGDPTGVIKPDFPGQLCTDTATPALWQAKGDGTWGAAGQGGSSVPSSWLSAPAFDAANGVETPVVFTEIVRAAGGQPPYLNGPDELALAGQLPTHTPSLPAGRYRAVVYYMFPGGVDLSATTGFALIGGFPDTSSAIPIDSAIQVTYQMPQVAQIQGQFEFEWVIAPKDVTDTDTHFTITVDNEINGGVDLPGFQVACVITKVA